MNGRIFEHEVCNLSRIPMPIVKNPIYKTCLQIQKDSSIAMRDTALYKHYLDYNPKTLFDMYGVVDKLTSFSNNVAFLPWIHTAPVTQFTDVAFMDREALFISEQVEKIRRLINSIRLLGYTPRDFPDRKGGNITGYWLKRGKERRFYVVSGNHRVSVCFSLDKNKSYPFAYEVVDHLKPRDLANRRKDILQTYDLKDVDQWPSVNSGFLTKKEAIAITNIYFEGKNE